MKLELRHLPSLPEVVDPDDKILPKLEENEDLKLLGNATLTYCATSMLAKGVEPDMVAGIRTTLLHSPFLEQIGATYQVQCPTPVSSAILFTCFVGKLEKQYGIRVVKPWLTELFDSYIDQVRKAMQPAKPTDEDPFVDMSPLPPLFGSSYLPSPPASSPSPIASSPSPPVTVPPATPHTNATTISTSFPTSRSNTPPPPPITVASTSTFTSSFSRLSVSPPTNPESDTSSSSSDSEQKRNHIIRVSLGKLNQFLVSKKATTRLKWKEINVTDYNDPGNPVTWREEAWWVARDGQNWEMVGVAEDSRKRVAQNIAADQAWRILAARKAL